MVRHSETLEELVLYEAMYENENGRIWVRPKKMFFEKIEKNNQLINRFDSVDFKFKNTTSCSETDIIIIQEIAQQSMGYFDPLNFRSWIHTQKSLFLQIAYDNLNAVGFKLGYALKQNIFFSWIEAVLPEYQSLGLGSVLMENQHAWCLKNNFTKIQTKCKNEFKQMIRLNLGHGFEIIGTESDQQNKIKILFEKNLG